MDTNRIERTLQQLRQQGRKALIPFLVAGDPDLAATKELALTMLREGADLLELGVPFSDPSAEGPVIMEADSHALANGVRLQDVFELTSQIRLESEAPILFLLYYNTIYRFGLETFFKRCKETGVDGVIVPDLPYEEQEDARIYADRYDIVMTMLISPLSGDRLPALVSDARGFLYCVAAMGVTGERTDFSTDLESYAAQLRQQTDLPLALGFGISSADQIRQIGRNWDAIIVGSAIVRRIAESAAQGQSIKSICSRIATFVAELRTALDEFQVESSREDTNVESANRNVHEPRISPTADPLHVNHLPEPGVVPDQDDFIRLATDYRLIPVIKKLPADTVTPISVFQRFPSDRSRFLLESAEGGERWSRYSIMGRDPLLHLVSKERVCSITHADGSTETIDEVGPVDRIRRMLEEYRLPPELADDGFRCGLTGYFAYDFIRYLEKLPDQNPDDLAMPDCDLMAPKQVVVYDHLKHEITLVHNVLLEKNDDRSPDRARQLYREAIDALANLSLELNTRPVEMSDHATAAESDAEMQQNPIEQIDSPMEFRPLVTRASFLQQVRRAKEYIKCGDIFQVVLSQRFHASYRGSPFAVYRSLRNVNPSPYLFYLELPDAALVGASPEMLVKLTGRTIETCPIAGTRKRGIDPVEDEQLASELLHDVKEKAEHAMLVDLARNDVGKISKFGSVRVTRLAQIEKYSHVMHLVSLVEGQIASGKAAIDVLCSLLPAGTLSGAPKIRAMEIIDELEISRRGPYGGAVGYLGFDGQMDTCITIRTAVIKDGIIHVQAGAGIVADSDPQSEYEESVNKAMALAAAIRQAGTFQ